MIDFRKIFTAIAGILLIMTTIEAFRGNTLTAIYGNTLVIILIQLNKNK